MIIRLITLLTLIFISNLSFAACEKVGTSKVLDATERVNPFNSIGESTADNCQEIPDFYKVTF